jgi:hypothetical protein
LKKYKKINPLFNVIPMSSMLLIGFNISIKKRRLIIIPFLLSNNFIISVNN